MGFLNSTIVNITIRTFVFFISVCFCALSLGVNIQLDILERISERGSERYFFPCMFSVLGLLFFTFCFLADTMTDDDFEKKIGETVFQSLMILFLVLGLGITVSAQSLTQKIAITETVATATINLPDYELRSTRGSIPYIETNISCTCGESVLNYAISSDLLSPVVSITSTEISISEKELKPMRIARGGNFIDCEFTRSYFIYLPATIVVASK